MLDAAALSMAALQAMITSLELQSEGVEDNYELEIMIGKLLVPNGLKFIAKSLYLSEKDPTVSNTNSNAPNTVAGLAEPVVSRRLSRHNPIGWYGVSDPTRLPVVQVSFLNGNQMPIISPLSNGSQLERKWEVLFDCTADALPDGWRGIRYNPGA